MASYLERQKGSFKASLMAASTRLFPSNRPFPSRSPAPPSPSPSIASATDTIHNTPDKKRKFGLTGSSNDPIVIPSDDAAPKRARRDPRMIPYSQPELTGYGTEINTHLTFIIEYLKG